MKLNKFVSIGLVAAITAMAQPAFAAPSEDFVQPQGACMIAVNDTTHTRFVNVEYVRLIQVEKEEPNVINIQLGSNFAVETTKMSIKYKTTPEAIKVLEELNDKINDCQYAAAKKRKKM